MQMQNFLLSRFARTMSLGDPAFWRSFYQRKQGNTFEWFVSATAAARAHGGHMVCTTRQDGEGARRAALGYGSCGRMRFRV